MYDSIEIAKFEFYLAEDLGSGLEHALVFRRGDGSRVRVPLPVTYTAQELHVGESVPGPPVGTIALGRFVGIVPSGGPIDGIFFQGDFGVTTTGSFYICITDGTPGTWVRANSSMTGQSVVGPPTGVIALGRFVGVIPDGGPTLGAFFNGDFGVTATGKIFVCTAPGTPGTWVMPSSSDISTPVTGITRDVSNRITGLTAAGQVYSSVTRDSDGLITSYVLNTVTHTVTRDPTTKLITGVS